MDISDEGSVRTACAAVAEAEAGPLGVVVANAGVQLFGQDAKIGQLDLAVWEKTVSINQRGAFLTLKPAVRAMEGRGGAPSFARATPPQSWPAARRSRLWTDRALNTKNSQLCSG